MALAKQRLHRLDGLGDDGRDSSGLRFSSIRPCVMRDTSSRSSTSRVSCVTWRFMTPTLNCARGSCWAMAPAARWHFGSAPVDCAVRAPASPGIRPSAGPRSPAPAGLNVRRNIAEIADHPVTAVGQRDAADLPLVQFGHAARSSRCSMRSGVTKDSPVSSVCRKAARFRPHKLAATGHESPRRSPGRSDPGYRRTRTGRRIDLA